MRSLRLRITSSNLRICRSKYIRSLLCKIITQSCQNSNCFQHDISQQRTILMWRMCEMAATTSLLSWSAAALWLLIRVHDSSVHAASLYEPCVRHCSKSWEFLNDSTVVWLDWSTECTRGDFEASDWLLFWEFVRVKDEGICCCIVSLSRSLVVEISLQIQKKIHFYTLH